MTTETISKKPSTIAILGGGPAGTSTALSMLQSMREVISADELASRYQVHLYDCPRQSVERVGETIPPAATPLLRKLGLADIVEKGDIHLPCPGSMSLWNGEQPGYNDFLLDAVGRGYHLQRDLFDEQLLAKACHKGVIHHAGWKLSRAEKKPQSILLDFSLNNTQHRSIEADFVVDATGKSSALARRLKVFRNRLDEVIFICAFIPLTDDFDLLSHTLVESVAEGWWYAARLPNKRMIVTFCTDQTGIKTHNWQQPENWLRLFHQTRWLSEKLAGVFSTVAADTLEITMQAAPSSLLSAVCGDNWLAVGDAASSYDPITSAGITKAIQQGDLAGRAITSLLLNGSRDLLQAYQKQVFDDFKHYVSVRNELYASEKRFTDAEFWMRRLGKI